MHEASSGPAVDPVLRPDSVSVLSSIVEDASRSDRSLYLQGGRTHERFTNLGRSTDSIVDLTGINNVIEYSPVDLTVAVECGVRLSTIDDLLAEHNQRIALDMASRDRATIGGTFASGLSGPRRLRYGSLKDMVIGAEVVNSRGEVSKSGGMVVKNVSGYELARLHYGAHGAFGVVSRINLKVIPAVESRVETVCHFRSPANSLTAAASVLVSALDPAAVYVSSSSPDRWSMHVQIEGNGRYAQLQRERVVKHIAEVIRPVGVEVFDLKGPSTPVFDSIMSLDDAENEILARYSVQASKQADFLDKFGPGDDREILADAGSGLVYVRMAASKGTVSLMREAKAPLTFLGLPDRFKEGVDVFGPKDRSAAGVTRRLKDEYDPDRLYNPGRFVSFL